MPNHVNNFLNTDKPLTAKVLHEQSQDLNGGLAMLVMPRPTDQEEHWYAWNCNNWGTKWGCYEQTEHDGQIDFTNVLDRLAKHFPNMILYYEEEQGWGGEIVYKNGTQYSHKTFDIPPFTKQGEIESMHRNFPHEVWYLKEDYQKLDEFYRKGWYYDGNLDDPVDSSAKILNIEEY